RKTFFQQQAERAGDEMGIAAKTGAMTLGSIGVDGAENEQNAQKKRAEKDRLNQLLALLDNHIAGLYKDLDYWKEQEQKYTTQEEALAKYIEGLESGVPADLSGEEQRAIDEAIREY